jgi:hypothetical protein
MDSRPYVEVQKPTRKTKLWCLPVDKLRRTEKIFNDPTEVKCHFDAKKAKCHVWASTIRVANLDCDWDEFMQLSNSFLA